MRLLESSGSLSPISIFESSQIGVGENVNKNDLLYLCGLSGKGFAVDVADYAAVSGMTYGAPQTDLATGRIVAQTAINTFATSAGNRLAVLQLSSGSILTLSSYISGAGGARLLQFSADGTVIKTIDIDPATTEVGQYKLLKLSNGNIAALFNTHGSPYKIKLAIYDQNLNEIKALTEIASCPTSSSSYYDAVALSAGGFAVVYQDVATPLQSTLITFDNTGTAVLTATTIWTRSGTAGTVHHSMVQLSNGNLAIAISAAAATPNTGLHYTIWTSAGVQVLAISQINSVSVGAFPEIVAGTGFFAIGRGNGTDQKAWVFNNAGAVQGSPFSSATTAGNANNKIKVLWDGTAFYLIWHRSSDSKCVLTKLPVTGTGYLTTVITINVTQYNFYLDAFCMDGYIVAASMSGVTSGADAPKMWVVDLASGRLVNNAGTTFGIAPTTSGKHPAIISGGDRSFIALYDYDDTAATYLCVGKWANTAILGVAADSAIKNSAVAVQTKPGTYKINPVGGLPNKAFDMSSSPILGGKGVIVSGGAVTLV